MKITLPEQLDLSRPERIILMIYIQQERYSFSLYNPMDDGSTYFHELKKESQSNAFFNFKEVFFDHEFLTLPFQKVFILNHSSSFTFVPTLIYEEKDKETYLNFNFPDNKDRVLSQRLHRPDITILHGLSEETYDFFQRSFVSPRISHYLAPLIVYFQEKDPMINAQKMIVNCREKGIDILCFSHGEFTLGNHFPCQNRDDAIYYILYSWKQKQLDQVKDFIFIAGDVPLKNSLMEELKPYLHNILPVNINAETHFAGVDIPVELSLLSLCHSQLFT